MTANAITDTAEIVWEDPPGGARGRPRVQPFPPGVAEALRAKPGKWARVGTFDSQTGASRERTRALSALGKDYPHDVWDAITRKLDDGVWGLWLMWVGRAPSQPSLDDAADAANDAADDAPAVEPVNPYARRSFGY